MSMCRKIEQKLRAHFAPAFLSVVNESATHVGHAGARPDGETHFRVTIHADAFENMTRIARHRAIMRALAPELDTSTSKPIHALAITAHSLTEKPNRTKHKSHAIKTPHKK